MEHFIFLTCGTSLSYTPASKMSIIIFLLNIQLVFVKKKLLCYNKSINQKGIKEMLNKENSKEYEKYLMKKKAELLKYLRRQSVNLGKFTSMDEYLDKLKKEEGLCIEGDATRLYSALSFLL